MKKEPEVRFWVGGKPLDEITEEERAELAERVLQSMGRVMCE